MFTVTEFSKVGVIEENNRGHQDKNSISRTFLYSILFRMSKAAD